MTAMAQGESTKVPEGKDGKKAGCCKCCGCCQKCCNSCKKCCSPFTSCCKSCYNYISPIITAITDFMRIFTQWYIVIDIITDILLIVRYFRDDTIPNYFAWILIAFLVLSFRFQALWITVLSFDRCTSDEGLYGKVTVQQILVSYIPLIGFTLSHIFMNQSFSPSDGVKPTLVLTLVLIDCVFSIFIFFGPILVLVLACYCWVRWINYLFCHGDNPKEMVTIEHRTSLLEYGRMSITDIAKFISTWESLFEAAPQTIINTYVTYTYVKDLKVLLQSDNWIIFMKLIYSGLKLLQKLVTLLVKIIKVLKKGGLVTGVVYSPTIKDEHDEVSLKESSSPDERESAFYM